MKFFSLRPAASLIAVLTVCAVLLLAPGLLAAQSPSWMPLGLYGGTVSSLAVHPKVPGVLYAAGSFDGVLKSTDGGLSWQLLPGSPSAASLVVMDPTRPEMLYAVGRYPSSTIYRSTDAGVHWTAVSRNLPVNLGITSLTVDPARSVRLYLAAFSGEVWRSGDSGATWRSVSQGLPSGGFGGTTALAAVPRKPAGTAFAGSYAPGLFRTRNAGLSWERVPGLPDAHVEALAIAPRDPQIVYVSLEGAGIYRTENGGDSWVPAGDPSAGGPAIRTLAVHPRLSLTVYAGTQGAIFKTTDGGQHWASVTPQPAPDVLTLAFGTAPPVLYAGTQPRNDTGGILRSANGGTSWTRVNLGLPSFSATAVAVDPADPNVLLAATFSGIYRSADRGAHWALRLSVDTTPWILAAGPGTFYLSPWNHFRRPVFKTSDAGGTWSEVLAHAQQTSLRADPLDPNTVYAIHSYYSGFAVYNNPEIVRSQNGGADWTFLTQLPDSCSAFDLAVTRNSGGTATAILYFSGARSGSPVCQAGVWRSPDGGTTWTEAAAGLPGPPAVVEEFAVDPQDTRVVYARLRNAPNVWKTMDSGASWQASGLGQRTVTKLAASPSPGVIWAYADNAVYRSRDYGATWQKRGDLSWGVAGFAFDPVRPERIYAATPRGVWVLEDTP